MLQNLAYFIHTKTQSCIFHFVVLYFSLMNVLMSTQHSLIRGVLIQNCPAGAKNFTNYVFCHPQFSGVIQNIENCCAILTLFVYVDYYQNNQFYIVKIDFSKLCFNGTVIFGTLAWTIELYMSKYIIGEIFSSRGATLFKNPSDQTVYSVVPPSSV